MSMWTRLSRGVRKLLRRDPRLDPVRQCAEGTLPATIALMQLAFCTADRAELEDLVKKAFDGRKLAPAARERLRELEQLARRYPEMHRTVRRITGAFAPRSEGMTEEEYWATGFDRAVTVSSEASVALYSFGDAALLQRITEDLVAKLVAWSALRPGARVLDYGCGIGRVTALLAERQMQVMGVDISSGMLGEARRRLAGRTNVELAEARDFLADKQAAAFDLALLVDVCPYLADARPLLAELVTRLAAGADLIVMNWSYDLTLAQQRAHARAFARRHGFALVRDGSEEFALWDGRVFHFRKACD